MDEETLKSMPEYVQKLPKAVRDVIFDGVWEERTDETAKKYSLDESQTDSLIDNVLYVLIGLKKPEEFLETIITELGISRLLAEQIMEDLEVRVFEYAVKSMEKKWEVENKKPKIENGVTTKPEKDIPEIRPEITPMIEPDEKLHIVEPPKAEETNLVVEHQETLNNNPEQQPPKIIYKKEPEKTIPNIVTTPAPTPQPIANHIETPIIETKPVEPTPTLQPNALEVGEPTKNVSSKPPEPVSPPVKKYVVDPYREPIE